MWLILYDKCSIPLRTGDKQHAKSVLTSPYFCYLEIEELQEKCPHSSKSSKTFITFFRKYFSHFSADCLCLSQQGMELEDDIQLGSCGGECVIYNSLSTKTRCTLTYASKAWMG